MAEIKFLLSYEIYEVDVHGTLLSETPVHDLCNKEEEETVEVDSDFGNVVVACHNESTDKIVSSIAASFEAWNLRPRNNDSVSKILQHEGEG